MLALGGTALAGFALASRAKAQSSGVTDTDILNFALNLEYLEANFYSLAYYGVTIDQGPRAVPLAVNGGTAGQVTLKPSFVKPTLSTPAVVNLAKEVADKETAHVLLLQNVLGSAAVSMPNIDLYNSFNSLADLAGIGSTFDPFADENNYLIGSFTFEDVGVTAYTGAAALITDKTTILPAAAGISGAEAYFAGAYRTLIQALDDADGTLATLTQQIAAARSTLANPDADDPANTDDIGLTMTTVSLNTATSATADARRRTQMASKKQSAARPRAGAGSFPATTIVDADPDTSRVYTRTTDQVLAIVTGGGTLNGADANKGGFFPDGLNGNIV